ncbi:thyrotropin-releasing hormone receptor-like [Chiloscyllium plagiosum]|uniref:thyrotropin-releasing hormone receptor-like n=1 Tax=Chiloscyllium plagiosum TaxID=36176 RepID=UPI001CB867EC|nr:thyrotropin-releasing hormone receptor-like [Chiloscyllium plagiosum]
MVAIVILAKGKCGLSSCITYYLVAMATADLSVVITSVILNRIIGMYFPTNYLLLTPLCRIKSALVYITRDCSVWFTVKFTFDRFVAICCQKLKSQYCKKQTAGWILGMVLSLSCLKNLAWYFVYEPLYIINNTPWYCRIRSSFYTSPLWLAFSYFGRIANPFLPFLIVLALNALTVRHIIMVSKARKALRVNARSENNPDPEMENRRKSIVLLFSISGNFLLLWLTFAVHYVYYRIVNAYSYTGYNDPVYILQETGYMLVLLSCCTNTFIYAVTQTKFRQELMKMVKYPMSQIVTIFCR